MKALDILLVLLLPMWIYLLSSSNLPLLDNKIHLFCIAVGMLSLADLVRSKK